MSARSAGKLPALRDTAAPCIDDGKASVLTGEKGIGKSVLIQGLLVGLQRQSLSKNIWWDEIMEQKGTVAE